MPQKKPRKKPPKNEKTAFFILASGNFLELYDFTVYGYFAPVIAQLFFPSDNPLTSLLATFFGFTLGFFFRPLGAIIFGHIGDVWSRSIAITISLTLMGLSSLTIALLPGYQQIGGLAPLLLLLLRVIQGLSMSGEVAGALVNLSERAPPKRQALMSSLVHVSGIGGMVAGSLTATLIHFLLIPDAVESWGWRAAYLIGAVNCILLAGLRVKLIIADEPARAGNVPVIEVCQHHKLAMLRVGILNLLNGACFFMVFVYINTYWSEQFSLDRASALAINTSNMLLMVIMITAVGWLSDKVCVHRLLLRAIITGCFAIVPCYWLMIEPQCWKMVVGQFGFSLLLAFIYGCGAIMSVRLLPRHVRMTGLALGYNTAQGFFGSLSPVIATWLAGNTGNPLSPAIYLLAVYITGLALLWPIPAQAHVNQEK